MRPRPLVWLPVVALAVFFMTAAAAQPSTTAQPVQAQGERERIKQQRLHHEAMFSEAERACFLRFAVNDCLRQARKERRLALGELRRQELALNDLERQVKALAALKRVQESASPVQPGQPERQPQ